MKRLSLAIWTSAILGIFCILGISFRMGFYGNELFILSTYVNRLVMGLVVGLIHSKKINLSKLLLRGAFFGLIISGSFYLATSLKDTPGFFAGIIYGIIIDYVATNYKK